MWARLAGFALPATLPDAARLMLEGLAPYRLRGQEIDPAWTTTLAGSPRGGPVRDEIRRIIEASVAA